ETFLDVLPIGIAGALFVRDATTTSNATETGNCAVDEVNNGIAYTPPNATFDGTAECQYTVCVKQDPNYCSQRTLSIASTPNPAVATIEDLFTVSSNVTNSTLEVLTTDDSLNPPGRDLFVKEVEGPFGGVCTITSCVREPIDGGGNCTKDASNDQVVLYDPPNNTFSTDFTGAVFCRYTACLETDDTVCEDGFVAIRAYSVDTPAVVVKNDQYAVFAGEPTDLNVLGNDISLNPPGRQLVVTNILSNAREDRGNCTANGTNVLIFTPADNFVGVATCQYKVCTSDGDDEVCGAGAVRITVKEATTKAPTSSPTAPPTMSSNTTPPTAPPTMSPMTSKSGKTSSQKGAKGGKKSSTEVMWEQKSSHKGAKVGKNSSAKTMLMWDVGTVEFLEDTSMSIDYDESRSDELF
ncbi:hypothetical protein ACHAWF_005891, partial [Thalassiosira exigua]